MLTGLSYAPDGSLRDDTGHSWRRASEWLEPEDAAARVRDGVPFVVEWCDTPPRRGRIERFKRDVLARMITKAEAAAYANKSVAPTVVVGALWSGSAGDCLVFVERGPSLT